MTEKLSERVERLEGPAFEIFEEAFFACNPGPSPFGCSGWHNEAIEQHNAARKKMLALLQAEAWLSAAEMLVPEGCGYVMTAPSNELEGLVAQKDLPAHANIFWLSKGIDEEATGATPANALLAAALKLRGL